MARVVQVPSRTTIYLPIAADFIHVLGCAVVGAIVEKLNIVFDANRGDITGN